MLSGAKSVWADAKDTAVASAADAIDRAAEAENIRQWQEAMKRSYIGSTQQDAESYASLIRMLLYRKGDGHRW